MIYSMVRTDWYQIYVLYRTFVIYTHTSMYPGQLNETFGSDEVATFATEIIDALQLMLAGKEYSPRSGIFSLFVAGFATTNRSEKQMVLDLLLAVEARDYRGSTEGTRTLLQRIYERQDAAAQEFGDARSVDWLEETQGSGQRFIL